MEGGCRLPLRTARSRFRRPSERPGQWPVEGTKRIWPSTKAWAPAVTPVLKPGETVAQALARLGGSREGFLLVQSGRGWSGITRDRLIRAGESRGSDRRVKELTEATLAANAPRPSAEAALRLMQEWWPVLPAVHRGDPSRLLRVVSLDDVLATYRGCGARARS